MAHPSADNLRRMLSAAPWRPAYLRWEQSRFLSGTGYASSFGVFDNFDEASAWLPSSSGFDEEALAAEYIQGRTGRVFPYDYPVMWWLGEALAAGAEKVLDIGGSVGVHFHAYRRYLTLSAGLTWTVQEVPTMVRLGRELARTLDAEQLRFTDDLDAALDGADLWLSAGAIHYIDEGRLGEWLRRCAAPPRHVLLNKLPLYGGDDFVTTQNIGAGCFAPMHVYNRRRFIADVESAGYRLRDAWAVPERSLSIPGHADKSIPNYSGLYFQAADAHH